MPIPHHIKTAAVIVPPFGDFYSTPHRFSSLGAQIVVQLLEKHGITVQCFNFPFVHSSAKKTVPIPQKLAYLKDHIIQGETGQCSFFTKYSIFGADTISCAEDIASQNPDIIFISCFAFCYADSTLALCDGIRKTVPNSVIVVGGAGVSAFPLYFIEHSSVDYALCGEAEVSIPPFLQFLQGTLPNGDQVPNLFWRVSTTEYKQSKSKFTQSEQIEPAFSITGDSTLPRINLTLSRGCPLGCTFCSNHLCHGSEYRHINESQLSYLVNLIQKHIKGNQLPLVINFEDDNLLLDFDFCEHVLKTFKTIFPHARFFAENGIDYRLLTHSHAHRLIDLGFAQFNFSLGSIHSEILNTISRSSNLTHYDSLLEIMKESTIPVITYFICGLADDTPMSIAKNLSFLAKRNTSIGISMYYPVPGIAGFTDTSQFKQGNSILCCGSSAYPWSRAVSTTTLITAFRLARMINCYKSPMITEIEKEVIAATYSTKKLHTIVKKNRVKQIVEVPLQDLKLLELFLEKTDLRTNHK